MKTNRLLLFLVLSYFSITSFGQYEKFDLGKYSNPYYKRQQLDLNLNLNGSNGFGKPTNVDNPFESTSTSFYGFLTGTYYAIHNSYKKQSNWQVSLNDNSNFYNQKREYYVDSSYVKDKSKSNNIYVNFLTYQRFYSENLIFFEIDFKGNASNSLNNSTSDYYGRVTNSLLYNTEGKNNSSSLSGELSLRIGKGRIENIEDARLAVYILEDLIKHNRLSRTPTDEEILEFSKVITQVKNERFFDTRIRKIVEITKADSFLVASNLVNKNDAAYFTTLDDNWVNASGPSRTSGFRYSIGISPSWMWNRNINSYYYTNISYSNTDFTNIYKKNGIAGDFQLNYDKPLNLKWQLNGALYIRYSLYGLKTKNVNYIDNSTSFSSNEHYNELSGSLYMDLDFYPNSRTSFIGSFGLYSKYANNKLIDPTSPTDKGDYHYISPFLSFSGRYYISERLRLSAYYSVMYMNAKTTDQYNYSNLQTISSNSKTFNQNFSMSLSYAFF